MHNSTESLIGLTLSQHLDSKIRVDVINSIITDCNLILDHMLWVNLFEGYWRSWREGYIPSFYYHNNRILTTSTNGKSKLDRETEVINYIERIIRTQHYKCPDINIDGLLSVVIKELSELD